MEEEKIKLIEINSFIEESKSINKNLEEIMEHFKLFLEKNNNKNRCFYLEISRDVEKICSSNEMQETYKYLK